MTNILITIIKASERAANVARSCCVTDSTKGLFISEKHESEANARFEKDFKTIADVLAQESARDEISKHFSELSKYIKGEECSEIGGITIAIKENAEKTAELLSALVPPIAAKRMAQAAHSEVQLDTCDKIPQCLPDINISDLGFWIDPIDATAEFIAGVQGKVNADKGLPCVTVLIGAYLHSTGEPILGVINQPFYDKGKGRIVWGISYNGTHEFGGDDIKLNNGTNVVLTSGAERTEIVEKIRNGGWEIKVLAGAGNKLLKVATGEAAAYVVSKGTTFRWDTCGPHAILRAMGGNILTYSLGPVTYNDPDNIDTQLYCNSEGIIAYTNKEVFDKLKDIIK